MSTLKITFRSIALIAALCAGLTVPAWAGWDEGLAAYDQGDYATALREFQPLAEKGHAESQFKLGVMYFNGRGVAQDFAKAMKWWRKAADQGHAEARNVSKLLLEGMNYGGAAEWYLKAAKQGNADAQYKLGFLYATGGRGLAQDYVKAGKWYRLAAAQGHSRAQYNLGAMYYKGQGVPRDYAEAVKWMRKAAKQGNALAQYALSAMHYRGDGLPQDYVLSHMWFTLAVANGQKVGPKFWGSLAGRMTPTQIVKAKKLAQEWWSKHKNK